MNHEPPPEHPASGLRKQVGPVLAGGKTLSIVIPAYNESKRIVQTFREIRVWLDEHFARRYEVLVVDDGSRDKDRKSTRLNSSHRL